MAKKITLNDIAAILADHGKEIRDLTGSVAHIVKHMATKEDIADVKHELKSDILGVREQVNSIERELRSIRGDLDELKKDVGNAAGYRKEIDHALERIARIEKHLGLNRNIAA